MGYQLVTPPAAEPLTLAEVKAHLRVDIADEDLLITALIVAVRQYAEQLTARSLITQTWKLVLDAFPGGFSSTQENSILIEKGPVQSINSIQYLDMSSTAQVATLADFAIDTAAPLARITPRFGKIWPIAIPQIGCVSISFTAGYGAAAAVPQGLKSWMLLRIGTLYKNREDIAVLQRGESVQAMPFVDSLLDPFTVRRI